MPQICADERIIRDFQWVLTFIVWVDGAEFADAAVRAYDEGEREGVPVFVGVGWVLGLGLRGVQFLPSSREMSVPLGPTVIQSFCVGS